MEDSALEICISYLLLINKKYGAKRKKGKKLLNVTSLVKSDSKLKSRVLILYYASAVILNVSVHSNHLESFEKILIHKPYPIPIKSKSLQMWPRYLDFSKFPS